MKLDYLQALKRVDEARGVWILHGQEPLLEQNLLDALRKSWLKHEIERLGQKGFRSDNAKKMEVSGQGYGLYNVKRIADLIQAKVSFNPELKILCYTGGIPQSNFTVKLILPESL